MSCRETYLNVYPLNRVAGYSKLAYLFIVQPASEWVGAKSYSVLSYLFIAAMASCYIGRPELRLRGRLRSISTHLFQRRTYSIGCPQPMTDQQRSKLLSLRRTSYQRFVSANTARARRFSALRPVTSRPLNSALTTKSSTGSTLTQQDERALKLVSVNSDWQLPQER